MNLLNNWLVQAIIGNVVCYILSQIVKLLMNTPESANKDVSKPLAKHSKHVLRKEFYISLAVSITCVPIFFLIPNKYLKLISLMFMFLGIFFMYCAFECSLECFDDGISNRSK